MLHVTPSKMNLPSQKPKRSYVHVTTRIRSSIITQLKSLLVLATQEGTSRSLPLLSRSLSQPLCVPLEWAVLSQPCACCLTWEQLLRAIPDLCFRKGCSIARNSLTSTCSQVTAAPPTAICLLTGNKSRDGSDCWLLTAPHSTGASLGLYSYQPISFISYGNGAAERNPHSTRQTLPKSLHGVLFEALPCIPPERNEKQLPGTLRV